MGWAVRTSRIDGEEDTEEAIPITIDYTKNNGCVPSSRDILKIDEQVN